MKKIFQKLKNYKYRNLICVLGVVLVFVVLPNRVFAQINSGQDVLNWGLYWIGSFFGMLVTFLIGFLMRVAAYNDFTTLTSVQTGWKLMRDVCNMFFIVIMMLIAVSTIIRYEAYNYKKILPTLLIKAVLINFSLMFCGLLIDASQVVTLTFVDAFKGAGEGNFIAGLGIDKVYQITRSGSPHTGTTMTLIFGAIMLAIATVVIGALVVVFLGRIIAFWLLIILSPFTFLASSSGGMGSKYADQWWTEFTKYLIVGPVLAFFLWLSLSMMRQTMMDTVTSKMRYEAMPSIGDGEAGTPKTFFAFMIATAMLLGSLVAAQQIGTAGSGAAGKTLGGLKAAGAFVAKGIPGYANEWMAWKTDKWTKGKFSLNLNAMDYVNAWKEARDEKHHKRLERSRGTIRDVAEYGYGHYVGNKLRRGLFYGKGGGEDGKRGFGMKGVRLANLQENLDHKQEMDKMRMDLGGEENAAGKQKLQKMKDDKNNLDILIQEVGNYLKQKTLERTKAEAGTLKKDGKVVTFEDWKSENDAGIAENIEKDRVSRTERDKLNTKISGADVVTLTAEAIKEEQQKANSKSQEIKNINDGYLSDQETHVALGQIENRLKELKAIKDKPDGKLNDYQIREEKDLESKKQDLEKYRDESLKNGQYVSMLDFNNTKNIRKYSPDELNKGEIERIIKKEAETLQKQVDYHKRRVEVMRETQKKAGSANLYDYDKIKERMADRKKKAEKLEEKRMAISGPDKFYRESARRALVAEEQKKIADVKESSELVSLLKKAQHEGDFHKFSAIAKQLAGNADDNEFLNGFGYMSNFGGFKDFFSNEVMKKMNVGEQEALALANDIAYINEGRNHWETARVAKNDNGEWQWNTEQEHTQAALGELLKRNDRELAQKLNRLAFGGEKVNEDGSRTFQFSNLGKALMYNCGQAFEHLFVTRKEGTSNLIFNIKGDQAFIDELRRNSGITENFYKFINRSGGPKKPADWYDYVIRMGNER